MAKLFSVSDEFQRLCINVDMYLHCTDVTPIHVLCCSVYRNFTMTGLDLYFYGHLSALCLFVFSFYSLNTNSSMF